MGMLHRIAELCPWWSASSNRPTTDAVVLVSATSAPGQLAASRPMTPAIRRMASSISASVVVAPRLKRTDDRKRSSGTRMAIRVGEGRVEPLAQRRAERGGDAGQVELHQERVAVQAGEPDIERLREPAVLADRTVADDPPGTQARR